MANEKDLALSDMIALTNPKYLKILSSSAYTTVSASVFVTGTNLTNIERLSLHVRMYSFPLLGLGNFP